MNHSLQSVWIQRIVIAITNHVGVFTKAVWENAHRMVVEFTRWFNRFAGKAE